MSESTPVERLSLGSVLAVLRGRWYIVLLCTVAVPVVTYFVAAREPDRFEATSKILFRDSGRDRDIFSSAPGVPPAEEDTEVASATNRDLIELPAVAERVTQALGGTLTPAAVLTQVEAASTGSSNVIEIRAEDPDARRAALLATTYAEEFIAYRRARARQNLLETRATLEESLARSVRSDPRGGQARATRRGLRDRIREIGVLAELQDGGAEVVQRAAVPAEPVAPTPERDAAIGGILGLLLGAILALTFHALDKRLRSVGSVESIFSRPVVGAIPQSRGLAGHGDLSAADGEAFRMLRANLRYYNGNRRVRSILVTSSTIGEGKSTVAWHLAAAGAGAGTRVLLIEADLRAPVLAGRFGIHAPLGLSDVLLGEAEPADVVHRIDVTAGEGAPKVWMDVMFAGRPPANPADLIESRMADLLTGAVDEFDLIIVDAPPLSVVPDAIPLIRHVDGALVVSRLGTTSREGAEHMRAQLKHLGTRPLGVVVNGVSRHDRQYGSVYQAAERYAKASARVSAKA